MEISDIKNAVEETRNLSDHTIRILWIKYQQTMDYRGSVIRENDWSRFRDWLFTPPADYHADCERSLITAMRRCLNISEVILMSPGQIPTFDPPDKDCQYLVSIDTIGRYILTKNRNRLYPSLIDIPLIPDLSPPYFDCQLDEDDKILLAKYEWDADSIAVALERIKDCVLSPLRRSHNSRCDITNIRLYVRETLPATGCLYIGCVAECIEN